MTGDTNAPADLPSGLRDLSAQIDYVSDKFGNEVTQQVTGSLDILAGILERAEEVRSDTLNGVINYILNGERK